MVSKYKQPCPGDINVLNPNVCWEELWHRKIWRSESMGVRSGDTIILDCAVHKGNNRRQNN